MSPVAFSMSLEFSILFRSVQRLTVQTKYPGHNLAETRCSEASLISEGDFCACFNLVALLRGVTVPQEVLFHHGSNRSLPCPLWKLDSGYIWRVFRGWGCGLKVTSSFPEKTGVLKPPKDLLKSGETTRAASLGLRAPSRHYQSPALTAFGGGGAALEDVPWGGTCFSSASASTPLTEIQEASKCSLWLDCTLMY